jgi:hypothetical protein
MSDDDRSRNGILPAVLPSLMIYMKEDLSFLCHGTEVGIPTFNIFARTFTHLNIQCQSSVLVKEKLCEAYRNISTQTQFTAVVWLYEVR